jgi:hypothetical protein
MAEDAMKPLAGERRVAFERRRRVAEMSPEEMRRELLTSEVTGLPNRRAFDEAGQAFAVAMSGLKEEFLTRDNHRSVRLSKCGRPVIAK